MIKMNFNQISGLCYFQNLKFMSDQFQPSEPTLLQQNPSQEQVISSIKESQQQNAQQPTQCQPHSQNISNEEPIKQNENQQPQIKEEQPVRDPFATLEKDIEEATELKRKGNQFFKQKNFIEAIKMYSDALRILDPQKFRGAPPVHLQKMVELSSNLLYNIGVCYFNGEDWKKADIFLSEAIIINKNYIKAIHKRALARYHLEKYENAFEDIKLAFSLDKTSADIHNSYSKILQAYNAMKKEEKQNMKELTGKIFKSESQRSVSPPPSQRNQVEMDDTKDSIDILPVVVIAVGVLAFAAYKWFKN